MTLAGALVLVEWSRGERLDRRFWLSLAPYVALGILGGIGLVQLVPGWTRIPPLGIRLTIACRAFWRYLATFVWPHGLLPVYPKWPIESTALPDVLGGLGVV